MLLMGDLTVWVLILGLLAILCIYWAIKWVVSLWTGAQVSNPIAQAVEYLGLGLPAVHDDGDARRRPPVGGEIRLVNSAGFLENVLAWRLLALEGRLRGGKTLFSVALARWLWLQGLVQGVFANFPIDPDFVPVINTCVNACVILDEAWFFADARKSLQNFQGYGAMFGKLGSYLISPSVWSVDKRMRPIVAEREVDLWVIDAWVYKWRCEREGKTLESGRFSLFNYQSVFDHYDHRFIPVDDAGIKEIMLEEIKQIAGSTRRIYVPKSLREIEEVRQSA